MVKQELPNNQFLKSLYIRGVSYNRNQMTTVYHGNHQMCVTKATSSHNNFVDFDFFPFSPQ